MKKIIMLTALMALTLFAGGCGRLRRAGGGCAAPGVGS